jgi:hypothetical protein
MAIGLTREEAEQRAAWLKRPATAKPAPLSPGVAEPANTAEQQAALAEVARLRVARFETLTRRYHAEGMTRGEAIRRAVADAPQAHTDYLTRVRTGNAGPLFGYEGARHGR